MITQKGAVSRKIFSAVIMRLPRVFICLPLLMLLTTMNAGARVNKKIGTKPFATGAIGNFVWLDRDKDGRQDIGEPGFSGVVVVLSDINGSVIATTITDSTGHYLFSGLDMGPVTGKIYEVLFKLPTGYRFSPKAGVISDPSMNSDADELSGKTGLFTLMAGQTNNDIDAGLVSALNGTLPLHTLELTTMLHEMKVTLRWVAENEMNTNQFTIQRSLDGVNYSDIGVKIVAGQINTPTEYVFVNDIQSVAMYTVIYYRIKAEDNIQRFAYSNIAPIMLSKIAGIRVWPNPFVNDISISYNGITNGKVDVLMTDNSGKIARNLVFDVNRGINQLSIKGINALAPGIYFISITDRSTNQRYVEKLTK
ncbi:MAG: SdrD B-like domain-containing protein [Bacteroidota bacterium]